MMVDQMEYFYKYRAIDHEHPDRTEKIFTQNEIYFPPPSKFNDPFDCQFSYSFGKGEPDIKNYFQQTLKKINPNLNRSERRTRAKKVAKNSAGPDSVAHMKDRRKVMVEALGVYSLSRIPDNILMWSHYADSHKGFCIQFLETNYEPFFGRAQPVKYTEKLPIVRLFDQDPYRKIV